MFLPQGPLPFDFKDPKEISAVSLTLDSPLEPIVGYAKGISGSLIFDPAHPERSSGAISVDVSSVQFANDGYTATAQGYALNKDKWPRLTLALRRVENVRRVSKTRYSGTVVADFKCRGITVMKRLAVTADYLPGRAEERTNGQRKGDLLVLRTRFSVSRKEHGISEGIPDAMVGDTVEVGVAVVGIHDQASVAPDMSERATIEVKETAAEKKTIASARVTELPRLGGGTPLSLVQAQGNANLVVVFLNEQCGVTIYYKERLKKMLRDFGTKNFRFVAVRTGRKLNPNAGVDLPERAYLPIPFLEDEHGQLMREYGIGQSLTFVVFDPTGRIRFKGGLDDHIDPAKVKKTPLRNALRELSLGKRVSVPYAPTFGCAILPIAR